MTTTVPRIKLNLKGIKDPDTRKALELLLKHLQQMATAIKGT
jgi:hypothetical protein